VDASQSLERKKKNINLQNNELANEICDQSFYFDSYARLLAHHPYAVIAAVILVVGVCFISVLTLHRLPTFEDPQLGFSPRGTVYSQRETAWNNLIEATRYSGPFTLNPIEHAYISKFFKNFASSSSTAKIKQDSSMQDDDPLTGFGIVTGNETESHAKDRLMEDDWVILENLKENGHLVVQEESLPQHFAASDFFCGEPSSSYSRVIFESVSDESLFTVHSFQSMCFIEQLKLKSVPEFYDLCELRMNGKCCPSWSLPNYLLLLRNKTSCQAFVQEDIEYLLRTLEGCSKFYNNLELKPDCFENEESCHGIPKNCILFNAVYTILHYLTDIDFLNKDRSNSTHLTYAMSFLPVACSSKVLPYFQALEKQVLSNGNIRIIAMNMGLKNTLFDEYLLHDTLFLALALVLIFLLMWMYTNSFLITIMTVLAIVFSLGIAYCLYTFVFEVKFFPFMNLLASVIVIGVGADDAFIYCKVWACAKSERNNGTLVKLVGDTLKHATVSMFVTSLTTATAFYASYVSSITAIKCFSLFAGTTVLVNFLLMITWLPATIVIAERWCSLNCCICIPPFGLYAPQLQRYTFCSQVCNFLWKLHYRCMEWARIFFEKILPCIVIKPRYLWLFLLSAIALCSVLIVFYYPGLQLPDSEEFQILSSDHPFEIYDLRLRKKFWFEKMKNTNALFKMPLTIVWGIKPVDNGDYLDPASKGTLEIDDTFDVVHPESQKWLLSFCQELRAQPFYQSTMGALLPNCFIETFKSWMRRRCVDPNLINRSPCCERSPFPFTERVFNSCIHEGVKSLYETPVMYRLPGIAGPRFSTSTQKVEAVVVEYDSNQPETLSYSEIDNFAKQVEAWVEQKLQTAPPGMKNGWFISYLGFYDLQRSLLYGTIEAIGAAMAVSFVVIFLTTLNILLSLYAVVTVASIICVTMASLVLLDWKMNVLESIAATVAIGLAVDFTLHYGVAYKLSPENDRESAVIFSLSRMGSPISMAAFTTFLAGLCMSGSSVLSYTQIGTFIMILMVTSWIYSTFFFQSILRFIGPENKLLQLEYPTVSCCCETTAEVRIDKTVYNYAVSESTLSTSSASYPNPGNANEIHELEPLATPRSLKVDNRPTRASLRRHNRFRKSNRQRSGSLTVTFSDADCSLSEFVAVSPRKVSLPTGVIETSDNGSSMNVGLASSSEDKVVPNPENGTGVWLRRDPEV
uniref:SSD domain-containing protein n=1 Tax=Strigamia maritima TaxID=126957 RepID=T1JPJ7_STRMM